MRFITNQEKPLQKSSSQSSSCFCLVLQLCIMQNHFCPKFGGFLCIFCVPFFFKYKEHPQFWTTLV